MTEKQFRELIPEDTTMWMTWFLLNYEINKKIEENQLQKLINSSELRSGVPETIIKFNLEKSKKELFPLLKAEDFNDIKYFIFDFPLMEDKIVDLSPLNKLNNLKALILDPVYLETNCYYNFSKIEEKKDLISLQLFSYTPVININFSKFPNLKRLEIDNPNWEYFSDLKDLKELKHLILKYCENLNDISFVKEMENLELLNIGGTSVTDFSPLEHCNNLIEVVPLNTALLESGRFIYPFEDVRLREPYTPSTWYTITFLDITYSNTTIGGVFNTFKEAFLFFRYWLNDKEMHGKANRIKWDSVESGSASLDELGFGYFKIQVHNR